MRGVRVLVLAALLLVGACGQESDPGTQSSPKPSTRPSTPDKATPKPSDVSTPVPSDRPEVLVGAVGEPGDPEAFTIALTDSSGKPVTTLEAGSYEVRVRDPAKYHNFHLAGPGVDKRTSVFGTGAVTWDVTLKPGAYSFVCDPHPQMSGDVTVTDATSQ